MLPLPPRSTPLSLHDALPIFAVTAFAVDGSGVDEVDPCVERRRDQLDRKSTRLNSSHRTISYAVFCLKKKKIIKKHKHINQKYRKQQLYSVELHSMSSLCQHA